MKDSSTAERVGRYQLLEPIGGGPNGLVSRAKVFGVAGFERQFAVKRFLPELVVGSAAQSLSAAARSYGSLEHPRIARMSEFGVAQGQTFTAVELVTGLDAFRLMQESKLASAAIAAGGALALVSQAARAVGYAHGRGLSHLGLSPTNVIVTPDGDVKVTDFGILAATMPARPIETPRLASRVPYLAPEQLAGETTSAATDVFVLGVIAYELVTGQRAYRGETPAQIAQMILAGPPAEPPLPRPIVRVLQRCLARSPFERFPDARALADALDAALRVAPVPGTRKDIGVMIKATLDRYAALNEGQMSGVVALNLRPSDYVRGPVDTEPSPVVPAVPAAPKPFSTVPGIPPPPIPAPPGLGGGPATPGGQNTMLGVAAAKRPQIPAINRPNRPPPPPAPSDVIEEPSGLIEVTDPSQPIEAPQEISLHADEPPPPEVITSPMPMRPPRPTPGISFETTTGEMSTAMIDQLNRKATMATAEILPSKRPSAPEITFEMPRDPAQAAEVAAFAADAQGVTEELAAHASPASTMPGLAPPPVRATPPPLNIPGPSQSVAPAYPPAPREQRSKGGAMFALIALVIAGGLGVGGFFLYQELRDKSGPASPPPEEFGSGGSAVALAATTDAGVTESPLPVATDAAVATTAPEDAQVAATADTADAAIAAVDKPPEVTPPARPSDSLHITSKPSGARVFIDGADQGVTPLKLPGTADRHTMAVLLPGHDLYLAEVDGKGVFEVQLKPVTPSGGHAGIKVIKCKDKERYYVYVDGNPTGMTCPTERIDTELGPHSVEVYDIVTETRRRFDILVKDSRLSVRVRIDD